MEEAIGIAEITSIAAGYEVCDAMVKAAAVQLMDAIPICPGKFMILVGGTISDVGSAMQECEEVAGPNLVEQTEIPNVHPALFSAIYGTTKVDAIDALGILETFTISSGIVAADAAVKAADVDLLELRLSRGQGGKAFFTVSGQVAAVRAAIEAGEQAIEALGTLVKSVVIPSPHESMVRFLY